MTTGCVVCVSHGTLCNSPDTRSTGMYAKSWTARMRDQQACTSTTCHSTCHKTQLTMTILPLNDSSDRNNTGGCRVMANFIATAPFFAMGNLARGGSAPAQRGVSHHSCTCTQAQRQVCIDAEHATRLDSQGAKPWHVWIEHDREWHARQQFQAATAHHRH